MRFHQLLARTALILAIIHPFLYRGQIDYQRPWDVTRQLTLTTDFGALTTGLLDGSCCRLSFYSRSLAISCHTGTKPGV